MSARKLSDQQQEEVRRLRASGTSLADLRRQFEISQPTLQRVLDGPALALQTRREGPPREDAEARMAEIPSDTRGLTARLFGDPLPGRSALDRRSQGV